MDMRAGSSYASVALISKLNKNPDRREYETVEMMMMMMMIEMYKVQVSNIK